ncbi:MBL fold metallo-hydrolase [Tsukamurella sp. 8F]|uniref:MBL fold metallo-hydrolase n=1 Tax=unclassified Tsukamurella TaxID=2633480 RepID=UPI0023B8FCB1|nr:MULTISPECIES: MBL fold metallo-hydrolase [unclassified Tsukamurella]MDF0530990.1 MBL fold metallo-hydrolase [Tsukamurella sp. 8J]MDF0588691.1 MBL fold metallo-hydrolase [Tsukamurella sp. 8F]
MREAAPGVTEVARGVFVARGTHVNFILLVEGSDVTLIDAGWHGDADTVERSVAAVGRRIEDVRAILLTHAHLDHVGGAAVLHDRHDIPILTHPAELGHARGEWRESAGPIDVALRAYKPTTVRWATAIVRAGALTHVAVPDAEAFPDSGRPLDLPGRPVPVTCFGHTTGHTAFHLPELGVVATGDALVTGHPLSGKKTPQLLPEFFAHDPEQADAALDGLAALDADIIAPGHGAPLRVELSRAVATARA